MGTTSKKLQNKFFLSKHYYYDTCQVTIVVSMGIAIGLAIGMCGLRVSKKDHLLDTITPKIYKTSYGIYRRAAVASDSKICSDVGRDIMAVEGGNAIDAAVATSLCSGVLHSQSTGIGGGMFAVVYHKNHGVVAIDARETAPLATSQDMFTKTESKVNAKEGGPSICVPGILKGYIELHSRFGSIPWKTVVRPTIKLLRDGFPLSSQTYQGVVRNLSPKREGMKSFEMFVDDNNRIKPQGSLIRMPKLARTMERISEDPLSFYNGSLTTEIIEDIQEAGSMITEEDLRKYQALIKSPTKLDLSENLTLYTVPSPAAGPTLSYILSTLSGYNMTSENVATDEAKIETYHRLMEAVKFAYARKTRLGDEDFVDTKSIVKNLTSRAYGELTRSLIDDSRTHDLSYYGPKYYEGEKHGTSHSSIIDSEGNAVAITSSINLYFGSQVVGNRTGILFNNQMNDFSYPFLSRYYGLQPAEANFVEPGKRPMSAMCPSIVWDNTKNKVSIVAGAAGGHKIPAALALMSVPESIDEPRILHELLPMNIQAEASLSDNIRDGLKGKGHTFLIPLGVTVVQMIQVLEDAIVAGSDFRKEGEPSGY